MDNSATHLKQYPGCTEESCVAGELTPLQPLAALVLIQPHTYDYYVYYSFKSIMHWSADPNDDGM